MRPRARAACAYRPGWGLARSQTRAGTAPASTAAWLSLRHSAASAAAASCCTPRWSTSSSRTRARAPSADHGLPSRSGAGVKESGERAGRALLQRTAARGEQLHEGGYRAGLHHAPAEAVALLAGAPQDRAGVLPHSRGASTQKARQRWQRALDGLGAADVQLRLEGDARCLLVTALGGLQLLDEPGQRHVVLAGFGRATRQDGSSRGSVRPSSLPKRCPSPTESGRGPNNLETVASGMAVGRSRTSIKFYRTVVRAT
mmetsp:Transcript_9793/g.33227  ORF Transcript_9793/g.33227 Transcript_9793/m.33227 type:complete len:258 (+) Transcript_9793:223-996(+)